MYSFYIDGVLLPVTPGKLTVKIKDKNKTMTLINDGEINFLKNPGLTDISFDAMLPSTKYPFAKYEGGFKSPSYFMGKLERLKTGKDFFQFLVIRNTGARRSGRLLFSTNMTVSLESYTIDENAKNGTDPVLKIKLKQYRPYGTKVVKVLDDEASVEKKRGQENSPAPKQDESYVVKDGDCLWNIAKRYYGDGSQYTKIYEANRDKIQNPNLIYTGQELVIPGV